MLSRVCDSLYWMARYLERAEHTSRLVGVQWNMMLDQGRLDPAKRWTSVLKALDVEVPEEMPEDSSAIARELVFDAANRSSIVSSIRYARENALQIREQISSEMWEQLNRLYHEVRSMIEAGYWDEEPVEFLRNVRLGSHLFHGLSDTTMIRGQGWQFIQLGRAMERACAMAQLLRAQAGFQQDDHLEWAGLLRSCAAFEAYCKVYTAEVRPEWILEFLALNREFPHSIAFCANEISNALSIIGRDVAAHRTERIGRLAGKLQAGLRFGQVEDIRGPELDPFLRGIIRQCNRIHEGIYSHYITYAVEAALEA